jgi:hypothetical protein
MAATSPPIGAPDARNWYTRVIRLRWLTCLVLGQVLGACASGADHSSGRPSTGVNADAGESGAPIQDATGVGGGGCPARADAAPCPAPPAGFGLAPLPPNIPPPSGYGQYWVGCEFTNCTSSTACTTCSCVESDAGAGWECANNAGFQPETDAQPTPYCALYAGTLDADIADVGPVEQCTPQYPKCTPPPPGFSPGWQCCLVSGVGGLTEISCMPNDAAAYGGGLPHP